MALTTCTECGQPVSTRARACPHCGAPPPGAIRQAAWGVAVTAALMAATLAFTIASTGKGFWTDLAVPAVVAGLTTVVAGMAVLRRRG